MTTVGRARVGTMLDLVTSRIEELRQTGLARVRDGALEEALGFYDEALAIAGEEKIGRASCRERV